MRLRATGSIYVFQSWVATHRPSSLLCFQILRRLLQVLVSTYDPDFDEEEPDPGICLGRLEVDSDGKLIPPGVVLYKVLTMWPDRATVSVKSALMFAAGYPDTIRCLRTAENQDFDGALVHPTLLGCTFSWVCRHLADIILALELEGRTELARDLASIDRVERERPEKLKAAKKFNRNLAKFTWASYQLFEHSDGQSKTSCDDFSAPYIARTSYPIRDDWIHCVDDIRLNDSRVYREIAESSARRLSELLKPRRKPHRGRSHGRPPDLVRAFKDTASAHVETSGGYSVHLLSIIHHSSVLGSLPESNPLAAAPRLRDNQPDEFLSVKPNSYLCSYQGSTKTSIA